MLRMAMYAQGVEIYCAPTVDDRETWLPTMRTIALEGRCFVLSACQFLRRSDCPPDYAAIQGDDPATVLIAAAPASSIRSGTCSLSLASCEKPFATPSSIDACWRGGNMISTSPATMRDPTFSN